MERGERRADWNYNTLGNDKEITSDNRTEKPFPTTISGTIQMQPRKWSTPTASLKIFACNRVHSLLIVSREICSSYLRKRINPSVSANSPWDGPGLPGPTHIRTVAGSPRWWPSGIVDGTVRSAITSVDKSGDLLLRSLPASLLIDPFSNSEEGMMPFEIKTWA